MRTQVWTMLVVCGLLLAACGGSTAPEQPAAAAAADAAPTAASEQAAPAASGERVPVRFWYGLGGQLGEVIEEQIAKFNASQDEVEVQGVFQQSYNGVQEKFQAALVSGDVPEIVQIEIHATPKFASAGALTPLESFYENDPDFNVDDLIPATLLNQRWEGNLYAMPINRSTPVMYYNKQLFSDAGLDPDKPPQTWQEFQQVAQQLTNAETETYGFLADPSWWTFESMVWSNGGEIMNDALDTVTFADAGAGPLQIWVDMVKNNSARVYTGQGSYEQKVKTFADGQGGMMFNSTASLGFVQREVGDNFAFGTAFMPHMEGNTTAVPTGGAAAGIPAKVSDEKKQAAWKFIKWWISPEQSAYWSKSTGYFPVRQSSLDLLREQNYYAENPEFETTIKQLEFAREAPLTPYWPAISSEINSGIEEALINKVPAAQALAAAQERAQRDVE